MEKQKKNLGSVAFLPLIVFLVCYVGCGITFTLMGADDPFGYFHVMSHFWQDVR